MRIRRRRSRRRLGRKGEGALGERGKRRWVRRGETYCMFWTSDYLADE